MSSPAAVVAVESAKPARTRRMIGCDAPSAVLNVRRPRMEDAASFGTETMRSSALSSRVVEARLAGSNLRSSSEVMAGRAAGSGVFCLLMHFRHRLFLAHVTPRRRHQHPVFSYPSRHCCSHCPSFRKILGSLLSSCPAMRRVRHEPSLTERGQT
jgi:hypothetical protein